MQLTGAKYYFHTGKINLIKSFLKVISRNNYILNFAFDCLPSHIISGKSENNNSFVKKYTKVIILIHQSKLISR